MTEFREITVQERSEFDSVRAELELNGREAAKYTDKFLAYYKDNYGPDYAQLMELVDKRESSDELISAMDHLDAMLNQKETQARPKLRKETFEGVLTDNGFDANTCKIEINDLQEVTITIPCPGKDLVIKSVDTNFSNETWLLDGVTYKTSPYGAWGCLEEVLEDAWYITGALKEVEDGKRVSTKENPFRITAANVLVFDGTGGDIHNIFENTIEASDQNALVKMLNERYSQLMSREEAAPVVAAAVDTSSVEATTAVDTDLLVEKDEKLTLANEFAVDQALPTLDSGENGLYKKIDDALSGTSVTKIQSSDGTFSIEFSSNESGATNIHLYGKATSQDNRQAWNNYLEQAKQFSRYSGQDVKLSMGVRGATSSMRLTIPRQEPDEQSSARTSPSAAPRTTVTTTETTKKIASEAEFAGTLSGTGWEKYVTKTGDETAGSIQVKELDKGTAEYKYSRIHHFFGKSGAAMKLDKPEDYEIKVGDKNALWEATTQYPEGTLVDANTKNRLWVENGTKIEWMKKAVDTVAEVDPTTVVAAPGEPPEATLATKPKGTADEATLRSALADLSNDQAYIDIKEREILELEAKKAKPFTNDKKIAEEIRELRGDITAAREEVKISQDLLLENRGTDAYLAAVTAEDPARLARLGLGMAPFVLASAPHAESDNG